MGVPEKKFKIEFSGKNYPSYRPSAVVIPAPTVERAEEWARVQLKTWSIDQSSVKVSVKEAAAEPVVQEEEKPKKARASKKKTK